MNLTDLSTRHWPSVAVAVALVALFGLTSIAKLPIQLLPTIEEPQVSIANFWRAAAPEEMEANIVEPQENVLQNTPGLTSINSFIGRGSGFVNLSFAVGTDIQEAKLDVINNLTQAPPRPGDAIEPQVFAGGGRQTPGAASLLVRVLPGNPNTELASYQKLIEDEVQPRLARIPGVSRVDLQGEQPRELHITFDSIAPPRSASRFATSSPSCPGRPTRPVASPTSGAASTRSASWVSSIPTSSTS